MYHTHSPSNQMINQIRTVRTVPIGVQILGTFQGASPRSEKKMTLGWAVNGKRHYARRQGGLTETF